MTDADMLTALQAAEQETGWRTPSLLVDFVVQKLDPTNAAEEAHFRAQAERVLHERNTCWGPGDGLRRTPAILVQKCPHGLMPYGAHSAPMLDDLLMGQVLTCKPRRGRTLPRNGAYWAGLSAAVKATDAWPTAEHLHDDLKRLCGYVDYYHNPLTGREEIRPQSTAFDKMSESEFAQFFRLAQTRFIAKMGFDPWLREDAA